MELLSNAYVVKFDVRQGSVLSPFLFAVWHLGQPANNTKLLRHNNMLMILISSSIYERIFDIWKRELMWLVIVINVQNLAVCVLAQEAI